MNKEIHTAIVTHITECCKSTIEHQFAAMLSKFGPTMGNASNDYEFSQIWRESVRPACDVTRGDRLRPNLNTYSLSEVKLDAIAGRHAQAAADEVIAKVTTKVGELENGELDYLGGASFRIKGSKGAHKVLIEQSQIINVSSKGNLFNQWPARIYVDGKLTSAAALSKIESAPVGKAAVVDVAAIPKDVDVVNEGEHRGTIVKAVGGLVFQHIGRGEEVAHDRKMLVGEVAVGKSVLVKYEAGKGTVTELGRQGSVLMGGGR